MKTNRNSMLALAAAVMIATAATSTFAVPTDEPVTLPIETANGSGIIQPEGEMPEGPIVFTEFAGMLMSCYHTNGVELAPAGCYVI